MEFIVLRIYFTADLNRKVLSFMVHYVGSTFPWLKLEHLHPIHVISTCLNASCAFHSEHRLDDAIGTVVIPGKKSLVVVKEPWVFDQSICEPLLAGNCVVLPLASIKSIDELVWKFNHSIGHLFSINHCADSSCPMSSPELPSKDLRVALCTNCKKRLERTGRLGSS